jgi:hypothetical protein
MNVGFPNTFHSGLLLFVSCSFAASYIYSFASGCFYAMSMSEGLTLKSKKNSVE